MANGAPIIVFSAPYFIRNGDVEHDYRASSDFYYLTGCEEPDCVLVLQEQAPRFTVFLRARDAQKEIWHGRRLGVEGARSTLNADQAYPIDELKKYLPDLIQGKDEICYFFGAHPENDQTIFDAIHAVGRRRRTHQTAPFKLLDAKTILHELRLVKTDFEIQKMRLASRLSAEAHMEAMRVAAPGGNEFDLQAALERVFRAGGSRRQAYGSIVGAGANATILHYHENSSPLSEQDLVLIDAGAELDYYAADITRTFPVSGRFSAAAARLYQIVLDAQVAAIERCRSGATLDIIHQTAVDVIATGLIELGWIASGLDETEKNKAVQRYYMHRTGHFLGMDVHDVGAYSKDGEARRLEENMVITVEPGLYVAEDDQDVPPEYRGIGIRIEDDIRITLAEPENMTESVPREIKELEAICRESPRSV